MKRIFNGLSLRMVLYFIFAVIAGQGIAVFDPEAGTLTFHVKDLEPLIGGGVAFIGTFLAGRRAVSKGGAS